MPAVCSIAPSRKSTRAGGITSSWPQRRCPGMGKERIMPAIDLSTTYLGLGLKNPLVVSASPLTENIENLQRMEQAGAAAIVMHSLFEEQITLESSELDCHLSQGAESYAESVTYFPALAGYNFGPDGYAQHLRRDKASVRIPI